MSTHVIAKVEALEVGIPGNRHHCAIANAIMLADPDIVHVRVDEERISFSRRSTDTRYEYATPAAATNFIREFDALIKSPDGGGKVRRMTAKPFTLKLTDAHLVRERPRQRRDAVKAVARTAVKAYGSTAAAFVEPEEAKPRPAAKKASPVTVAAPVKVARIASPRKRPSQRVA